jgi:hypothetical protein
MPSQGVIDRQRVAKVIASAARTHAREVGTRLQEVLAPAFPEGLVPFDLVELHEGLARYLEQRIEAIIEADDAHLGELRDDKGPRLRRDQAADELYSKLVGTRELVLGVFGSEQVGEVLGYDGSTPDDPVTLQRVARKALELLRRPAEELPPPRFSDVQMDLASRADELQPAFDQLTAALREVDDENRSAESTRRGKDLELDAFDAAVAGIGRVVTGFDQLAGFPQFAERVRLTLPARRRRGSASEGEEPPQEEAPTGVEAPRVGEGPPAEESPGLPPLPQLPAPSEGLSGGDA